MIVASRRLVLGRTGLVEEGGHVVGRVKTSSRVVDVGGRRVLSVNLRESGARERRVLGTRHCLLCAE